MGFEDPINMEIPPFFLDALKKKGKK